MTTIRRLKEDGPSLFRAPVPAAPRPKNVQLMKLVLILLAFVALLSLAMPSFAQSAPAAPATTTTTAAPPAAAKPGIGDAVDRALGQLGGPGAAAATNGAGKAPLSLSLQVLIIMGLLTILPGILLMMTSFTRIIIVLSILRQALGLQQTPPNQVLIGLSLFLTFFVMSPTIDKVYTQAWTPYQANQISFNDALDRGQGPLREFMLKQTRQSDVQLFAKLARLPAAVKGADVPFRVLVPAFVASELKTAFQIGFLIFIPFLIIDMIVASVLMSLGMMMLSPVLVALPFKLMLFVLADGWNLMLGSLAASFS